MHEAVSKFVWAVTMRISNSTWERPSYFRHVKVDHYWRDAASMFFIRGDQKAWERSKDK